MGKRNTEGISISVSGGLIVFTPSKYRAHPGGSVSWNCAEGPFAVQFFGVSPLETCDAQSEAGNQASRAVRRDAVAGTYPYACAVFAEGRVYLDANCPAIIIDQP
ncbi:MAG: hypothetical protein GXY47_01370 [Acidobacteria bacterium]|nr:hypothetical protein [Acidobacteriota bacterium]